jgi:hypothetical protein
MRGRGTHRPTITLLNASVALAVIALLGALLGGHAGQTETVAMQQPSGSAQAMAIPKAGSADRDAFQTQRLVSFLDSVDRWLEERGADPFSAQRRAAPSNEHWPHVYTADIISMPDTWQYPWYASWDLTFDVPALTLAEKDCGEPRPSLMLREPYLHPRAQIPADEWTFGDVNLSVHAWSTIFAYGLERIRRDDSDLDWREPAFHKLALNFTWWVNRKNRAGSNGFEGGCLGLNNFGCSTVARGTVC